MYAEKDKEKIASVFSENVRTKSTAVFLQMALLTQPLCEAGDGLSVRSCALRTSSSVEFSQHMLTRVTPPKAALKKLLCQLHRAPVRPLGFRSIRYNC